MITYFQFCLILSELSLSIFVQLKYMYVGGCGGAGAGRCLWQGGLHQVEVAGGMWVVE